MQNEWYSYVQHTHTHTSVWLDSGPQFLHFVKTPRHSFSPLTWVPHHTPTPLGLMVYHVGKNKKLFFLKLNIDHFVTKNIRSKKLYVYIFIEVYNDK